MDCRSQTIAPGGTAKLRVDALLLVLVGDAQNSTLPSTLDAPLAAAVQVAISQGDLALKAGKHAYLRQVAGVQAPRLAVVVARDGSAKALKAAAAQGLGLLKGLAVKHLAVQLAGLAAVDATCAEAVASAAAEAVYLYRTTKPSAAPAPVLAKLSLLVASKAEAKAADEGLVRGAAIGAGVRALGK